MKDNELKSIHRKTTRTGSLLLAASLALTTLGYAAPATEVNASSAPTPNREGLALNSAACFSLGVVPTGGRVEAGFAMSAHRMYTLYGKDGNPERDITSELISSPGTVYDDFDWDGKKVAEESSVRATFYDYQISLEGGAQPQVMRARYGQNEVDTQAYRLEKVDGTWENTGKVLTFSKDNADGQIDIKNLCGQTETRDAIKVEKWRLLKDGGIRRVKNAVVWLADQCILHDRMTTDHFLRPQRQPEQPPREELVPETPGRREVPAPVQLPRSGDGSVPIENLNPNIPRWPGH